MSDAYIQLPADSTGKKVDTEELTVGANTVERERVQIAGASALQIAPVDATAGLKVNLGADNDVTITSGTVTVGTALPAGSNNIGDVDIASALPSGSNNIGDVDVLTLPGTAGEAAALPSVFVVVAGDDGTDTQPVQLNAAGDLKVTLDSETVDVSDRAARDLGKVDIAAIDVAIPAGDNNIGNVDIASAIPAGSNNIGDVDVATVPTDPFGANADAASATGSISAKLRYLAATGIAGMTTLPAGTNAIGKLAANSGVDIGDVDIASIATGDNNIGNVDIASAIPTGANKIGVFSEDIIGPCNGATALTPKFAVIDCASSGDNSIVAAVSGKKIRVLAVVLVCSGGANTVTWKDGSTAKSGGMGFAANGGYSVMYPYGLWEGTATTALNLNLSAATSVDGHITYVEV